MALVGRDLKHHPVPTLLLWAACHPPDQAAQSPIQPRSGTLASGGFLSLTGARIKIITALPAFSPHHLYHLSATPLPSLLHQDKAVLPGGTLGPRAVHGDLPGAGVPTKPVLYAAGSLV